MDIFCRSCLFSGAGNPFMAPVSHRGPFPGPWRCDSIRTATVFLLLFLTMALGSPHTVSQGNCSLSVVQEESAKVVFTDTSSLMLSWTCTSPVPTTVPSILTITSLIHATVPLRPRSHLNILTMLHPRPGALGKPSQVCLMPKLALLTLPDVQPSPWGSCQLRCQTISDHGAMFSNGILFTSRYHCLNHHSPLDLKLHCQMCGKPPSEAFVLYWRIILPQSFMEVADAHRVPRGKRNINISPQFQTLTYQVSVPENKPAGTFVVQLRATDPDAGEFGQLEYSMDALFDSRSSHFFFLDRNTGVVTTTKELDRETKATHVFKVIVTDAGIPRRTAMATLSVTVSDTNDHDPVFEQSEYRESVRENMEVGYEVMTVRATDGDSPINANIAYRIVSETGEAFEIDSRSGVIRMKDSVDREERAFYQLVIEADDQGRDPGPRSSTTTVYISVEDENDNAPQFSEKHYVARAPEDTIPDSQILVVTATDKDQGINAVVHYSILSGNARGLFSIDPQSGAIFLAGALDFETGREHTLRIRAQDGGRPPLSNVTGLVTVQVLDVNDNAPVFVSGPFQAAVLENSPLGYSVLQVQALDADAGENSRLEYRLTGEAGPFSINNSTGWIIVQSELDREDIEFFNFEVETCDHGHPSLSSSAAVNVQILDVNDNAPEFTQSEYQARLNEDAAVGTSVMTVLALDRDFQATITYQITSGNTRHRFSISSLAGGGGLLTLALPLDYKLEKQFILTITASDGMRTDTARVVVNVTDANTHRPVFQSSHYTVSVKEDQPAGTTVVIISASDEDTGENARITYLAEEGMPQFSIDPDTGAVTTTMELDYEVQVSYTLAITAHDNGIPQKSDTTYLEILVTDVNDNPPVFQRASYSGTITEDAPVYTSVLQISATDRDSGLNGRVFYTFTGGDDGDGDFTVEYTSGIVRTLRQLDRENVVQYRLKAFAVDKGHPTPHRTPTEIIITVLDVNDNAPVFARDELEVMVLENSPLGLPLATITATDPDEGVNAQIMYQIVEGNIPEVFQLDIFSGELNALVDLDYEERPEYLIVVQATSAPLVSRATVRVRLVDVNDNAPTLSNFRVAFNHYVGGGGGSFPRGVIGKVPAQDPDISDSLSFTFLQGNELGLLLLNASTGELQLSRDLDSNRPLEAAMEVAVTDGVHRVTAQCTLQVTIITDEMLSHSITLRLGGMSQQQFLSPMLPLFIRSVAYVLSVPAHGVVVFSILDDSEVTALTLGSPTEEQILNVSLLVHSPEGIFLPSEILRELLYLNRTLLAILAQQKVLPFDDNVCLREPCPNYMLCVSALRFDSSAPFLASDTLLFRPIMPVGGLRCRCPTGFAGEFCETEVDLCYTGPCGEHGICLSHEGGYTCQCNEEYSGPHCEISLRSARCSAGLCRNGAVCVNLLLGGFHCECPPGEYEAPYCMVTTRAFDGESFITFRGLRQRFHFKLSLSFATREQNGLLMYNGRFNGRHDFIVLEVKDEQVQLTFSAGEFTTTVSPFIPGGVSDGQWHTVHLHYFNKPVVAKSGDLLGPSEQKVAVITVDNCNTEMSLRFGDVLENYTCAAQGMQSGTKKSLDLTGPLLLGGIPNLPEDFPVRHKYFVGCMKDLIIDNKAVDLGEYIANNGTVPGCPAKRNHCEGERCQHGGTCVNRWNGYSCECPLGYGGKNCEKDMQSTFRFLGDGEILWRSLSLPLNLPWHLSLMIRTQQSDALLLQAEGEQNCSVTLQMSEASPLLSLRGPSGIHALFYLPHVKLNDGVWHHISLELQSDPKLTENHLLLFQIDYGQEEVKGEFPKDLIGTTLSNLSIGAAASNGDIILQGFRGCLQGVRVGASPLPIDSALLLNIEPGCSFPDPCDSSPCPAHSYCRDDWDNYSCACHPGYYGNSCISACDLNPCKHQSTCVMQVNGYICECSSGYYGPHCESRLDQPCARGWWGHPVCGPCHCDASKGFDTECNKTTGECHCKDNHFHPPGAEACIQCDCYATGSLSRTCDPITGQCPCKSGVIGRQCDRCDNPFAEVTANGCEVNYDSCPRAVEAEIWWPRTRFGLPTAVSCPKGSVGTAIRHCDEHRGWLPSNLSNCTSRSLIPLKGLLDVLKSNMSTLSPAVAQSAAHDLLNITQEADAFLGSDVLISYQLLNAILQKQSQESGFNLAATQDVHFTENVVKIGSFLLDLDTKEHWALIQASEAGTALLLKHYETYMKNVARNMKHTYLNPFTINTPNIVVSVTRLDKENYAGVTLPQYETLRGEKPSDQETALILPITNFMSQNTNGTDKLHMDRSHQNRAKRDKVSWKEGAQRDFEAVVTVIIYHGLGTLLPERWDPDKRSLRVPKRPVINSPVVSIYIHEADGALDQPITVQFRLRETQERSKPICVHWNHSLQLPTPGGGWSARGCELVFRNETHISCQCNHMTSFAVLMDMSRRENGEVLPLRIITYSCIGVTLGFLLLTLLFLCIPRSLRFNQHSIHRNLLLALFLSQLSFILGINQADLEFSCTIIAILLHFLSLCCFSWVFLEVLHIYRRLSEVRDVNTGPMRFYYALGWGVPAFITGLAVGLDPEGYGNPDFCWLSVSDTLIWSFAGPAGFVISTGLFLCIVSGRASCAAQRKGFQKKGTASGLRCSIFLLLLVSVSWILALLSVNSDLLFLHYTYAGVVCAQGPLIFLISVIFSKDVHRSLKHSVRKMNEPSVTTKSTLTSSHPHNSYADGQLYHMPFGSSTGSLHSSIPSRGSHCYLPILLRTEAGLKNGHSLLELKDPNGKDDQDDSDSESDFSVDDDDDDHSCSFASTQSSDSDEEDDSPRVPSWDILTNLNNEKHFQNSQKDNPAPEKTIIANGEILPMAPPDTSPKPAALQPQKGILKKQRSVINQIHNELGQKPSGREKQSIQGQVNGGTNIPMSVTDTGRKESSESEFVFPDSPH
ncbi:cadherin EGF LAG seven-pass G-type receptor 2-like isoform X1 [Rana temporaria]|uniref:cadherin EGF LAG seven-pass G-type receptor 2-like isoform X1 n=2 Tax=Rana temporaria TaxID=8407 RepID=UPI001AAD70F9|nr:cadherin EGF LAG seven-pass G-type receptor 2-like isoform X1 [Rana temporaria]